MCKWPLKSINRRQMYVIRRQTIVPNIDYTITKMEFASINITSRRLCIGLLRWECYIVVYDTSAWCVSVFSDVGV